jgi:hypothetical protein
MPVMPAVHVSRDLFMLPKAQQTPWLVARNEREVRGFFAHRDLKRSLPMKALLAAAAILVLPLSLAQAEPLFGGCGEMQSLAQEHANDMARRDRLDHAGFKGRAASGARAENVAYGSASEAGALAQWRGSPRHARNMRLGGCKGVASAQSRSGRIYWVMVIGR